MHPKKMKRKKIQKVKHHQQSFTQNDQAAIKTVTQVLLKQPQ